MDNTNPSPVSPTPHIDDAVISPLLAAWQSHQDNRARGASLAELMASRDELDWVRQTVRSNLALAS